MTMSRPYKGAIRRLFEPALWINYSSSGSYHSLHCKMHHIQVREACLPDFIYLKSSDPPCYERWLNEVHCGYVLGAFVGHLIIFWTHFEQTIWTLLKQSKY